MAKANKAIAAVNGSYFDVKHGGSVTFLQSNGQVIARSDIALSDNRHNGAIAITKDGQVDIILRQDSVWQHSNRYEDILSSGPVLSQKGNPITHKNTEFNLTRHPRTSIGITEDQRLLVVTADGRAPKAAGVKTNELALLMDALGAVEALNLDGGGSTTLWIKDQGWQGTVNYPSDNDGFNHKGGRPVANAIIFQIL